MEVERVEIRLRYEDFQNSMDGRLHEFYTHGIKIIKFPFKNTLESSSAMVSGSKRTT